MPRDVPLYGPQGVIVNGQSLDTAQADDATPTAAPARKPLRLLARLGTPAMMLALGALDLVARCLP